MPSTMLLTMLVCFALSVSVAVAIGLASLVGAWQANLNFLAVVKEMFSAINKFALAASRGGWSSSRSRSSAASRAGSPRRAC